MSKIWCICAFAVMLPAGAFAETAQDSIVGQLSEQGFTKIEVNRTFLGRLRFVAVKDHYRRELVFNPSTGEIMRDYWQDTLAETRADDQRARREAIYRNSDRDQTAPIPDLPVAPNIMTTTME